MTPPKGIRDNNPFNLIDSSIEWQGQTGADGRFCMFDTMVDGLRAGIIDTCNHVLKDGVQPTLNDLIGNPEHGQAPANENDTQAYIATMASHMGIAPDATIDIRDASQVSLYVTGIALVENGEDWASTISAEEVSQAITEAFQHLYGGSA